MDRKTAVAASAVVLVMLEAAAQPQWYVHPPISDAALTQVRFVDEQHGWILRSGSEEFLLRTTDGGVTWSPTAGQGLHSFFVPREIQFVTPRHGWLRGQFIETYEIKMRVTSDGGESWSKCDSIAAASANAFHALDANSCVICGDAGLVLYTRDKGGSWFFADIASLGGASWRLRAIHFVDDGYGWIVGDDGVILRTTNGAETWTKQESGTGERLSSVFFVDRNNGWAAGRHGLILHTTNGGASWAAQNTPTTEDLSSVKFIDPDNGFCIGLRNILLQTTDGGAGWSRYQLDLAGYGPMDMCFAGAGNGWIVGTNGLVIRTQPTGIDGVSGPARMRRPTYSAIGYNRVGDRVRVALGLNRSARLQLRAYTAAGRCLSTIAHGRYRPGQHRIDWCPAAATTPLYLRYLLTAPEEEREGTVPVLNGGR